MTAKIKLNSASGGGSVSLQAPSSSSNNRVFTIPDEADATLLTTNTSTGKIVQIVQATKTDVDSSSDTTWEDIVGMSLTITPSSSSSKILISVHAMIGVWATYPCHLKILRGTTDIHKGDALSGLGNATRLTATFCDTYSISGSMVNFEYLDSPNTTSATTYKLQWKQPYAGGYTMWINRCQNNTNDDITWSGASNMIAKEVAA